MIPRRALPLVLLCCFCPCTAFNGVDNLMRGQDVYISSSIYPNYPPSYAVDGDSDSFTDIRQDSSHQSSWLMVTLDRPVYLKSILLEVSGLQNFFILTTDNETEKNLANPHPHPNHSDWTIQYYVSEIPGGAQQSLEIKLYTGNAVRHVAVFQQNNGNRRIYEIEAYDYNVADRPVEVPQTDVSSSSQSRSPERAIDGNVDMFEDNSYYSAVVNETPYWWRTDLVRSLSAPVIKIYPFLRIKKEIEDEDFSRLRVAVIMTSPNSTSNTPNPDSPNWNACKMMPLSPSNMYTLNLEQNGPTLIGCEDTVASIAVFKNSGTALEIGEIKIFNQEPKFASETLTVTNSSVSYIHLRWTEAERATKYRYYCYETLTHVTRGEISWRATTSLNSYSSAFPPNTRVSCGVMAVGTGGVSSIIMGQGKTQCNAPLITDFDIAESSRNGGREIIVSSFQVTHNCASLKSVKVELYITSSTAAVHTRNLPGASGQTATFSGLPAVTSYDIKVTVYNNEDKSNSRVESIETGELPPGQVTGFNITSSNSICVRLTWRAPSSPNGDITNYSYKCDRNPWTSTTSVGLSVEVCDFVPYEPVSCSVRGRNGAGDGAISGPKQIRTRCAAPAITDFEIDERRQNSRREITVTYFQVTHNCASLKSVKVELYIAGSTTTVQTRNLSGVSRQTATFSGLPAVTAYDIKVTVYNSEDTSTSSIKSIETGELPPGQVTGFNITSTKSSCVQLTWRAPSSPNGLITSYSYKCNSNPWTSTNSVGLSVEVCDFDPYKLVSCSVRGRNGAGDGVASGQEQIRTRCAAPSKPGFEATLSIYRSSDSLLFEDRVQIELQITEPSSVNCANIKQYRISLVGGPGHIDEIHTDGTAKLTDLRGGTKYEIQVIAVNNEDYESIPEKLESTTTELAPSKPVVESLSTNETCLELRWSEPLEPNGIITKYKVGCNKTADATHTEVENDTLSYTLCGLDSGEDYSCTVTARTSFNYGSPATRIGTTIAKPLSPPRPVKLRDVGPFRSIGLIPISIDVPQYHRSVTIIELMIVVELASDSKTRQKRQTDAGGVDVDQLYGREKSLDRGLTYYATGRYQASELAGGRIDFDVGDGKNYGGFVNYKLNSDSDYKIHYGLTIEQNSKKKIELFSFDTVFNLRRSPSGYIALIAVLLLLAIAAVVVLVLWKVKLLQRCRTDKSNKKPSSYKRPDKNLETEGPNETHLLLETRNGEYDDETRNNKTPENAGQIALYGNVGMVNRRAECSDTALTVEEFKLWYKSSGSSEEINEQYKIIEASPKGDMSAASDPRNAGKNRYRGLYPFESHRVKLARPDDSSASDYINASYIAGYGANNDQAYIAAMAPNESTVNDFWLMIWQQDVRNIVMVTKLVEDGKSKSEQYWPNRDGPATSYGDIIVKCTSDESWADFAIRTLEVRSKTEENDSRFVTQYNYLAWPDHGVPNPTAPFVMFYKKVLSRIKVVSHRCELHPLLVHCSAGVGRSGTYIALDYLLKQANQEGRLDVFKCVRQMRERRPAMVQRGEQYQFVFEALLESLEEQDTEAVSDSATATLKLKSYQKDAENSDLTHEYHMIVERINKITLTFEAGSAPENREKNRHPDILPGDNCRPYLISADDTYINAVFVASTKKNNKFLATQIPLPNTLDDFWVMVYEHKCSTIVQLEPFDGSLLNDQGFFQTRLLDITQKSGVAQAQSDTFETLDFQITHTTLKNKPVRQVRLINCHGGEGLSNFKLGDWITLYELTKTSQRACGDNRITVMCSDGASLTGVFVNVWNMFEKLELEREADVYNSVLMSRMKRPQFINSLELYGYLYEILNEFIQQCSEYDNFTS